MKNNNQAIIRKITGRALKSDKRRNFFIVAAIALTAFMLASVFSIGVSYYESVNMHARRLQGSVAHMGFMSPTEQQLEKVYTLDYVSAVGIGVMVAYTRDVQRIYYLDMGFIDETHWHEFFAPASSNIIGSFPVQENEIMLSRFILNAMGIADPYIGMEIPLSYTVMETGEVGTETFVLSLIYTEYTSVIGESFVVIYVSRAFAERTGRFINENIAVNVMFTSTRNIPASVERLKADLEFSEDQYYAISPEFDPDHNMSTFAVLGAISAFLMVTGYLLIYNVMYMSVAKDVRFYGILKTIGTTPRQIRRIIFGQILRLSVIGLPIGCLASVFVTQLLIPSMLHFTTGVVVSFSPVIYIGTVVFAVLTALVGALTPAKKAANVSPIEATKFLSEEVSKTSVHSTAKGKPYRMAIRNMFRDRKRAIVVMLSLFLGTTTFIAVTAVVSSMSIDSYIDYWYRYDFSVSTSAAAGQHFLSDNLVEEIRGLPGIAEIGAITLSGQMRVEYAENLDYFLDWYIGYLQHSPGIRASRDELLESLRNEGFNLHVIGIDRITFNEMNKTLDVPVEWEAFERGEVIFFERYIPYSYEDMDISSYLADISTLSLSFPARYDIATNVTVGGVVQIQRNLGTSVFSITGAPTIYISNAFLQDHGAALQVFNININAAPGYDSRLFYTFNDMMNRANIFVSSRYEASQSMQDNIITMAVFGGGISLILGLIGIFNFVNVMSVAVLARKRELATLESIGMSKKQMRAMLRNEGMGYGVITILGSAVFGSMAAYALYSLMAGTGDGLLVQFTYPVIPVLAVFAVLSLICFIMPEIAYKSVSKLSLVERLREAE